MVVLEDVKPRSYRVRTEDGGEYIWNRRHLLQVKELYLPENEHQEEDTGVGGNGEKMEDPSATSASNVALPGGDPENIGKSRTLPLHQSMRITRPMIRKDL